MVTVFRPVNRSLPSTETALDDMLSSPTTPKPGTAPRRSPKPTDDATTSSRDRFPMGGLASQKPLPTDPFAESMQETTNQAGKKKPKREDHQPLRKAKDLDDIVMDDSEGDAAGGPDGTASDDESVNADGTRANKKKKSQRFYCTGFPPCNLSFTRSEHLARHIRKHTGERPFQCHCSRRFSRLDNLRQHAQTVHVNEEIPIDSLAATGTRFQRQIRTDRLRSVGGRTRVSTAGSIGPIRGHAKSLSASSIGSIGCSGAGYGANEARRRPPPLVMATDARARLSLESYRGHDGHLHRPSSPSEFGTPTSATFSTGQNSPRWGLSLASPTSSHSRPQNIYTSGRRLSVPSSAGNPFHSPRGAGVKGPVVGVGVLSASKPGVYSHSQNSQLSSPIASSSPSRRESEPSAADEAWRRRTWHPETGDSRDYIGSSRLSQILTPSQISQANISLPVVNPRTQSQQIRLPGIESFVSLPHRTALPPRRIPTVMMIDPDGSKPPAPLISVAEISVDDRRSSSSSQRDTGLNCGITKLDINTPTRDSAGAWASEVNQAVLAQADQVRASPMQTTVRFSPEVTTVPSVRKSLGRPLAPMLAPRHQHTMSAPSISTRGIKRHGWCHGPVLVHQRRESIPEDRLHVDRIIHPNVSQFQAFPDRDQLPVSYPNSQDTGQQRRSHNADSMNRLEALVAVATCENSIASHAFLSAEASQSRS